MDDHIFSFLDSESQSGDYPLAFGGSPLDRLDERRKDDIWLQSELKNPCSRFILIVGDKALMTVQPNVTIGYLGSDAAMKLIIGGARWVLLGAHEDNTYFALWQAEEDGEHLASSATQKLIDLRTIAQISTEDRSNQDILPWQPALLAEARSLLSWHQSHRYCAKCGEETVIQNAGFMRKCPADACSAEHFPRTDPVVIMLAIKGDKCLLGRGPTWPARRYSALAGFMEPGETIEEAVRRELWEEAGIKAGRVKYFASQPWPFPSSLMIGCFAEALTDEIEIRDGELEDAIWVDKKDAEAALFLSIEEQESAPLSLPPKLAIAHHLILKWVRG